MWINIKDTQEWIPFDQEHTEKLFLDGEKGWAIKQKDGKVYHISKEQYEKKVLREIDPDAYWKIRNIEDVTKGLTEEEITQVKKILKSLRKKKEEDE